MTLNSLRVQNFRNHEDFKCEFSPTTTLIHGMNGTGKTSLLEAVYVAYRGTSFKGVDSDIMNDKRRWYRVDLRDDSNLHRTIIFDNRTDAKKKQFVIDDKKSVRLPAKYKKPIILFTPDDLRLVDGSPSRRRKYLDTVIAQYDPQYSLLLRRYERTLLQRNKLLKQPNVTPDSLFSWNVILSECGAYIINARITLIDTINTYLHRYYRDIANIDEDITAEYTGHAVSSRTLLAHYEANFDRDRLLGSTGAGPHRHDLVINMRDKLAADSASRGEARTIVVSLKYIEAALLHDYFNEYPLVLLDDVFGELDESRQRHLLSALQNNQLIITSAHSLRKSSLPTGTVTIEL